MDAEDPKAKSKSVSLLPELWEQVEAKASAQYGGNRSAYFRELAEADLSGQIPHPENPKILVELARLTHFYGLEDLRLMLDHPKGSPEHPIDQAIVLRRFLKALSDALKRDLDPEVGFDLVPAKGGREEFVLHVLAEMKGLFQQTAELGLVAESGVQYGKPRKVSTDKVRLGQTEKKHAG